MVKNLLGAIYQVSLVITNTPFLTEARNQSVCLGRVMTRHRWEEMVVYLVLKSFTEPVENELGDSISSSDITGGSNLQLTEVSLVSVS